MNTALKAICTFAAFTLAFVLTGGWTWGDDVRPVNSNETAKILTEAAKPSAEHARLEPLIGNWTYTGKSWLFPNQQAVEMQGTIEREWVLGGRFIEERYAGTGIDGKPGFEGRALLGYDNTQKKFTSSFICNQGTGTFTGLGIADAAGTFTFQTQSFCPIAKKIVHGREVLRIEGSDRVVHESYVTEEGKERKIMEYVAVRQENQD